MSIVMQGLESADTAEWQSFDLSQHVDPGQYLTEIDIIIKGTGSGAPGFKMLDLRVVGTIIDNPTGVLHVRSSNLGGADIQRCRRVFSTRCNSPWLEQCHDLDLPINGCVVYPRRSACAAYL